VAVVSEAKRRVAPVEIDPLTGERRLKLVDENKLQRSQYLSNRALLRLEEDYRTLVLFGEGKTHITPKQDPILQLALKARDLVEESEDQAQQSYFRELSKLLLTAKGTITAGTESLIERLQKDRHHKEKMELAKSKADGDFSEADLIEQLGGSGEEETNGQ
jgi:hypothetical protein